MRHHITPQRIDAGYGAYLGHAHDPRTDDPEWSYCELCDGDGSRMVLDEDGTKYRAVCEGCDGAGRLWPDGSPVDGEDE